MKTALLLLALATPLSAYAAGPLDPSFGTHYGHTPVVVQGAATFGLGSHPAADGGWYVSGVHRLKSSAPDAPVFRPHLVKLRADGSIDTAFGQSGFASFDRNTSGDGQKVATVVGGGRIYQIARTAWRPDQQSWIQVFAYTTSGEVDTSFGTEGYVELPASSVQLQVGAALQNGKLLIAASRVISNAAGTAEYFMLTRLQANGAPDLGFGQDGVALMTPPSVSNAAARRFTDLAVMADGRIVAAGRMNFGSGTPFTGVVARLSSQGVPDTGFGNGGFKLVSMAQGDTLGRDVAIQRDGKVVLGASACELPVAGSGISKTCRAGAARLLPDGQLDPAYGVGGVATLASGLEGQSASTVTYSMAIDAKGRVLLAGMTYRPELPGQAAAQQAYLMRFAPNGQADGMFGTGGVQRQEFGASSTYLDLHVTSTGGAPRIVAVGQGDTATGLPMSITARHLND